MTSTSTRRNRYVSMPSFSVFLRRSTNEAFFVVSMWEGVMSGSHQHSISNAPCQLMVLSSGHYGAVGESSLCVGGISWRSQDCHKVDVNPVTLNVGDIASF